MKTNESTSANCEGLALLPAVLQALNALRSPGVLCENQIHAMVADCFLQANVPFVHEAKLGKGARIDFFIDGVGVEIKKGKPNARALCKQVLRYAHFPQITAIVVITQRAVCLPATMAGKPVHALSLSKLWGVSLP